MKIKGQSLKANFDIALVVASIFVALLAQTAQAVFMNILDPVYAHVGIWVHSTPALTSLACFWALRRYRLAAWLAALASPIIIIFLQGYVDVWCRQFVGNQIPLFEYSGLSQYQTLGPFLGGTVICIVALILGLPILASVHKRMNQPFSTIRDDCKYVYQSILLPRFGARLARLIFMLIIALPFLGIIWLIFSLR